jgi:hypothetical protein
MPEDAMTLIGHNNGPAMDSGTSWRRHCWQRARSALLPVLPVEVLRLRVRRAQRLGLDYRTYAGIRAASGHDVIGFLFSSNALRVMRPLQDLPGPEHAKLVALADVGRVGLAREPVSPDDLLARARGALDRAAPAPHAWASWSEARATIRAALMAADRGWPADCVVLVGAGPDEPGWAEAARLAAFVPAARFFVA